MRILRLKETDRRHTRSAEHKMLLLCYMALVIGLRSAWIVLFYILWCKRNIFIIAIQYCMILPLLLRALIPYQQYKQISRISCLGCIASGNRIDNGNKDGLQNNNEETAHSMPLIKRGASFDSFIGGSDYFDRPTPYNIKISILFLRSSLLASFCCKHTPTSSS